MSSGRKRRAHRGASSTQLARQWAILRLLEARAYSIRELADELGSSKSSIQRDLSTLAEHFMIVAEQEGQQKRMYRLERNRAPINLRISPCEIRALEQAIQQGRDGELEPLRTLRCKLLAFLAE